MIRFLVISFVSLTMVSCSQLQEKLGNNIQGKSFNIDKLWVRNTLDKDFYGYRHPHRMSPILYKGMVIQGNAIDGIGAFDQNTGNRKWFLNIKGGVEAGAVIQEDKLYMGAGDGFFYAVEAFSGQVLWKTPINAETLSRPTFYQGVIYFIAGNNRAYALEANTGKVKWSYSRQETSTLSIRGGSQPEVSKETLYLGFSDGTLVALNLVDGKLKWEKNLNRNRRFRDIDAQPTIDDNRLYVAGFDGGLYCINPDTGTLLWQHEQGGFSAATIYEGVVYYTTTDGYVVALDKVSGQVKWRYKLKVGLGTRPTFFRGLLVFGEYEGDLIALEARTGKLVGRYSPGRGIMSQPTIDANTGRTYFISVNANLFAMKLQWRTNQETWPWDKTL
ncbi:MAG: PQQ-binding-like beta-propeller repeat protein [Bdellovibrionales bacterium]|nr:PQQ-binding-like beta-propeller repeat protein [Bdellovibrionales bacterium]